MTLYCRAILFSFSLHVQHDCVQYLTCIQKNIVRLCKESMQKSRVMVNTGFLSTCVFGPQELEEQRNAMKHGEIKVKPYESVYS